MGLERSGSLLLVGWSWWKLVGVGNRESLMVRGSRAGGLTKGCSEYIVLPMIKTITKIGNSQGIIFDSALLQLARLKVGDEVNIEIHAGGTITISSTKPSPDPETVSSLIDETMTDYAKTMKRLA